MPRVFITNDSGQDYSAAEQYGDLIKLTKGPCNIFHPEDVKTQIESKLYENKFNNKVDFVLLAGAALPCALLFAHVAVRGYTNDDGEVKVQCLMFDVKRQEYVQRTVTL